MRSTDSQTSLAPLTLNTGRAVALDGGTGGATLGRQSELPKLPIPPLEDTMQRYLRAVVGLQVWWLRDLALAYFDMAQTPEEHEKTKQIAHDFQEKEGKALQQKLQDYAENRASFIEAFTDEAYLSGDEPTVLALKCVSPFAVEVRR